MRNHVESIHCKEELRLHIESIHERRTYAITVVKSNSYELYRNKD